MYVCVCVCVCVCGGGGFNVIVGSARLNSLWEECNSIMGEGGGGQNM